MKMWAKQLSHFRSQLPLPLTSKLLYQQQAFRAISLINLKFCGCNGCPIFSEQKTACDRYTNNILLYRKKKSISAVEVHLAIGAELPEISFF